MNRGSDRPQFLVIGSRAGGAARRSLTSLYGSGGGGAGLFPS